jgi:hypothetical protein
MNFLEAIPRWEFMDEPLYRWFLFAGAWLAIAVAWASILGWMKG